MIPCYYGSWVKRIFKCSKQQTWHAFLSLILETIFTTKNSYSSDNADSTDELVRVARINSSVKLMKANCLPPVPRCYGQPKKLAASTGGLCCCWFPVVRQFGSPLKYTTSSKYHSRLRIVYNEWPVLRSVSLSLAIHEVFQNVLNEWVESEILMISGRTS